MARNIGYFDHECDLPITVENNVLELPPYLPKYKLWFYSLRRFFILDEQRIETKRFFRSYASLRAEKKRHLEGKYWRTIHPFSKFAIYKEKIVCILWMISMLLDTVRISFFSACDSSHVLFKIQWTLDTLFILNIIVNCFTGYCDPFTKEIILDPKRVIKERAFWFLIPETLASLPVKPIIAVISHMDPRTTRVSLLSIFRLFRILRLCDIIRTLTEILQELNVPESMITIGLVFLLAFYLIHWLACLLYYVPICHYTWDGLPSNSWLSDSDGQTDEVYSHMCSGITTRFFNLYILVIIRSTCHFFGAGDGYRPIELPIEKFTCSIGIILGYIYWNYAMAKVLELYGSVNISESKYEELMFQVSEYVKSKNISDSLTKRLWIYYEYKYQKKFFKEEEILSTLSEHLRCEVFLYTCKNVLDRVPLLNTMSRPSLGSIVSFMQREIYLPNDVVLKYGEPMQKMIWVSHGTLAVYFGPDGVEILHFEDGDHFCDLAITKTGGLATLSIVALEITEVFTLDRRDIRHCTSFLKEMSEKVIRVSKEKQHLYKALAEMMSSEETQNRVLGDLRKGRILEKDRFRKKRKHFIKGTSYLKK